MADQETKRIWAIKDAQYRIEKNIESLTPELLQHVHNQLPAKDLINVFVIGEEPAETPLPDGSRSIKWGTDIYYAPLGIFPLFKVILGLIFGRKKHLETLPFEINGKKYEIQVTYT